MLKHSWVLIATFAVILALHGNTEAASRVLHGNSRIIGGKEAKDMDIPYIVSLTHSSGVHHCGGSILNERTIITAAHCLRIFSTDDLMVHAGTKTLSLDEGVLMKVEDKFLHPEDDIALLRLKQPLSFGPTIKSIRLPCAGQPVEDNSLAMVAGWGLTSEGGEISHWLRYVMVPIVNQQVCKQVPMSRNVTDNMICAGDFEAGGIDSCKTDSGGPLVYNDELIGIVSWGDGCARPGKPGVYVRVAALRTWVDQLLKKLDGDNEVL